MQSPFRPSARLCRQLLTFGAVGLCATGVHLGVAWSLMEVVSSNAYLANMAGAAVAFTVSLIGNAVLTFKTNHSVWHCAPRYLAVSAWSLLLTSAILAVVRQLSLPNYWFPGITIVLVPPTTFTISKLWAFSERKLTTSAAAHRQPATG